MKKSLSVFLIIILILSIIPLNTVGSFAQTSQDGKYEYCIINGKVKITSYHLPSDTDAVEVPDRIEDFPVTEIGNFCFSECSLSSVIIPDSVLRIGDVAFEKCKNLSSVKIGAGLTEIGTHVFTEAPKLVSIEVSPLNTHFSSVDGVLYNFERTLLIAYPLAKPTIEFTVPDSVQKIEAYAFAGARNLKSITIGTGLTVISDRAFIGAYNVENVTIMGEVTEIGPNAFGNMNHLTSINLPDSLIRIEKEAFQESNSLKSILIPSSVNYIGDDAFEATPSDFVVYCHPHTYAISYCNANDIEWVSLYGGMPDGWCGDRIHYSFDTETGKLVITGQGEMYDYFSFNDELHFPEGWSENIKSVVIEEGITMIGFSAFEDCEDLEVVALPKSLECIGFKAFSNCKNLCEVSIPANVITIGYEAFANCTNLSDISLSDNIEQICGDAFINTAYYNDSSNWKNGILYIGPALIRADEDLNGNCYIEEGTTCIADSAFMNCAIQRVVIPSSVKYICYSAFLGCYLLADIKMSENIINIELGAFDDTAYFENAKNWNNNVLYVDNALITSQGKIPESYLVRKGTTCIAEQAFLYSSGLKNISIPESVSHIGIWAIGFERTSSGTPRVIQDFVINGITNSCAESYANENEIQFNALSHIHEYDEMHVKPKATSPGYVKHYCSCGNYYYDTYTAPTGKQILKCKARATAAQTVTWNNVKTATGYQVQISTKDGKNWSTYATLKAGITAYTFKNLAAGNNYKFRVRFYIKAADGKNYYSPWSATLNSPTLPGGTSISKIAGAKKAFTAQWGKKAVTGYQLQYATNAKFTSAKLVTVKNAATCKYLVKNLKTKTNYYVRIRTYKTIARVNYYSTWSVAKTVRTK